MLNNLKNRLTQGWNFMRFVRLALAITIIVQAITSSEIMFAVLGGFLLFQAAFNYGCCSAGGCDIDHNNSQSESSVATEEVTTFKEVK
jgi:hypothetical protein